MIRRRDCQVQSKPGHGSERGFALPMTIFLVTMITLMLASAFTRAAVEHQLSRGVQSGVMALGVAQSGLQAFFGDTSTTRPITGDSLRYNVVGGYAWVFPQELMIPNDTLDDFVYIIRSEGYYIEPNLGSEPQGHRSVAQFARWKQSMVRPAAYVAANRNNIDGSPAAINIDGQDECSSAEIAGSLAPYDSDALDPEATLNGTPPEILSGSAMDILNALDLDWAAIENGEFTPDHTSLAGADGNTAFDTYLIDEYQTDIGGIDGTGLLIHKNRIDTYGFQWRGVVITGKDFDVIDGYTSIRGMLITGLDSLVGTTDYPDTYLESSDTGLNVIYNSCFVATAFRKLRHFVPMKNAWVDNWASY